MNSEDVRFSKGCNARQCCWFDELLAAVGPRDCSTSGISARIQCPATTSTMPRNFSRKVRSEHLSPSLCLAQTGAISRGTERHSSLEKCHMCHPILYQKRRNNMKYPKQPIPKLASLSLSSWSVYPWWTDADLSPDTQNLRGRQSLWPVLYNVVSFMFVETQPFPTNQSHPHVRPSFHIFHSYPFHLYFLTLQSLLTASDMHRCLVILFSLNCDHCINSRSRLKTERGTRRWRYPQLKNMNHHQNCPQTDRV